MISTVNFRGQRIDQRRLGLQLHYSMLPRREMLELAERFFRYANGFIDERFCARWSYDNKTVSAEKIPSYLSSLDKTEVDFGAESFVKSDLVFNQKTLHELIKTDRVLGDTGHGDLFLAPDYLEEYARFFAHVPLAAMKERLLEWFTLPGRVDRGEPLGCDADAWFSGTEHYHNNGYYFGEMDISVMAFCLGSELSAIADDLFVFAEEIAGDYSNCNALITLSPNLVLDYYSPHMAYFSRLPNQLITVDGRIFYPAEYYRYAYLCGAEWGNVLSAKLLKRLPPQGLEAANPAASEVKILPNGAASVKLRKEIGEADVADLAEVKRLLYSALYPGERRVEKKHLTVDGRFCTDLPRRHWERVPIFPEEIIETEDAIIYRYCENLKINDAAERHTDESAHTP